MARDLLKILKMCSRSVRNAGTTLPELMVAITILAAGLTGLFATFSMGLQEFRFARQTAVASESLFARTERLREVTWAQLADSNYLANSILNTAATAEGILPQLAQQVTVADYPTPVVPTTPIVVARSATGTVSVTSSNTALASSSLLSVKVRQTWTGARGISRAIETGFITSQSRVKR